MSCIKFPSTKSDNTQKTVNTKEPDLIYMHLIKVANDIFGNGKWSHSVTNQVLDFCDYNCGKFHAGCVSTVRVQLLDGTFHEDIGYSTTENQFKGLAIFNARSGSVTNALKKVLTCFGGRMVNAIDKSIISSSLTKSANSDVEQVPYVPPTSNLNLKDILHDADPLEHIISQTDKAMMEIEDFEVEFEENINGSRLKAVENIAKDRVESKKLITESEFGEKINGTRLKVVENIAKDKAESNKLITKNTTAALTEEELRLERKRKQREKQEEFKKKYQVSSSTITSAATLNQPNPRY